MNNNWWLGYFVGIIAGVELAINCYNAIKKPIPVKVKLYPVQTVKLIPIQTVKLIPAKVEVS